MGASAPHLSKGQAGESKRPSLECMGPDCFFTSLPPALTLVEQDLADAVINFIREWETTHSNGKHANFVHLGADLRVRQCKTKVLPPVVALRSWVEQRLAKFVEIAKN